MKESGNKNGKINTRLKGVLIILASAVLIAVDLVLTFIGYYSYGRYEKGRVLGLLLAGLLLCLLWGFYGIVLVIQGDKKGGKISKTKNVDDVPANVNKGKQKQKTDVESNQKQEKEKTTLPNDNQNENNIE